MRTKILVAVAIVLLGAPIYASAQTTNIATVSSQVQALIDQIKSLQVKIATLKTVQDQVTTAQTNISQTLTLIRSLRQGISGDDVKTLQAVLAADPSIYPEGMITGYYGRLTSEAVKKFQNKYGIEAIGSVGPKTLKKLNEEIGNLSLTSEDDSNDSNNDGNKTDKKFCVPPGHLIAPGWLKKNNGEKPDISECRNLPTGIANKLGDDNERNNDNQDKTAPVITNISTNYAILANSATSTVKWVTNEIATGKVWYGTTTPLVLNTPTLSVYSGTLELNHSLTLTNLSTSTTYYYVLESHDPSGNTSTTTQNSFAIPAN
jgi:peptidoglycan hydrolase-like protein with peptidoglycan-binding domain